MIEPVRFEDGRPMLLAGPRQKNRFAEMETAVPKQWQELERLGTLPGQVGTTRYGAIAGTDMDAGIVEYMAAVEVEDLAAVPEGVGRMRVPAQRYAIFEHHGHISGLRKTWDSIWGAWVPQAEFKPGRYTDFERYDERFDPRTGSGVIEIWFPIEDKE